MDYGAYYFSGEPDFSIGKAKRADVRFVSDSHYHDTYEIYYLVSGTRRQFVNHTIYDMKKGDLILIPKGSIHKTTAIAENPHTRYLVNFSESFSDGICKALGESIGAVFETMIISVPESRRAYLLNLFEKMEEEYKTKGADKYADAMIRNYLSELFVFILRRSDVKVPDDIPEKQIQSAARFIYDNYDKDITLAKAAKHVHMSESYFSKKFKAVTGLNFSEYIVSTRIKKADELLINTNKSVSEIAELCGFSDANYFGDVFKKKKGLSPNKYRKSKSFR